MKIYLVQQGNGTGGGMRLFLAGTCGREYIMKELNIYPYILESFYMMKPMMKGLLPFFKDFLLDSGAFSFMANSKIKLNWDEYVESYANFIKANSIKKFFELDIDKIIGYDQVKEYRKKLEHLTNHQCIPVWHKSRGIDEFYRMCDEYSYVSIGGIVTQEIKPDEYCVFPELIKEAHKRKAKIHGLGFTNLKLLPKYHFDSVDSTSWTAGNRFGRVDWFDGKTIRSKKKKAGQKMMNVYDLARHNFTEWVKYQRYAEDHL